MFGNAQKPAEVDLAIWTLSWIYLPSQRNISDRRRIINQFSEGFKQGLQKKKKVFEDLWKEHKKYVEHLANIEDEYWALHDLIILAEKSIPDHFFKKDAATESCGPYKKFFERDHKDLNRRLAQCSMKDRIPQMEKFFLDHMLKGEKLGVIK